MMTLGLSLALGASPGTSAPPVINPNLLTKTEQLNAAAWAKSGATATADFGADPLGGATADRVVFSDSGTILQTSATPGSGTGLEQDYSLTSAWARYSVSGSLGSLFTFSIWLKEIGAGGSLLRLTLDVVAGSVRCGLMDIGDTPSVLVWGAKLETGSLPTGDASTYGAVG